MQKILEEYKTGKGDFLKKIKIVEQNDKKYLLCEQRLLGYPFQIEITDELRNFLKLI